MKRFSLITLPILILSFVSIFSTFSLKQIIQKDDNKELVKAIDLGFIVEKYYSYGYKSYCNGEEIVGECVTINGNAQDLNKISDKLGLMITNKYVVEDKTVIEGVSAKLKYQINGRQANVQIVFSENQITIGSPIIYGSY